MELPLQLEIIPPQARFEPGTARSAGLHLTHSATRHYYWELCQNKSKEWILSDPSLTLFSPHTCLRVLYTQCRPSSGHAKCSVRSRSTELYIRGVLYDNWGIIIFSLKPYGHLGCNRVNDPPTHRSY